MAAPPPAPRHGQLLVVDDDAEMCAVLVQELRARGFTASSVTNADAAFTAIVDGTIDVVITDLRMRGKSGLDLCERVVANRPDVPVVVMTAFGSMDTAIATLRAGAFDFLTKPFDMEELAVTAERALGHRALREELKRLRRHVEGLENVSELIGESRVMAELRDLLERIADSETSVLVTGESGSGKEVVARTIHRSSRRADGPFTAINCAAVPEALLESELFGYVKGAFTDAKTSRKGLFVEADRGTLLLDEVGEMPLSMQAKLLRALETRQVRPVGGTTEVPFDVRILAATNRDLEAAIAAKTFREDLYYRINVVHVEVPPLRARGNDVLILASRFLKAYAKKQGKSVDQISPAVAEKLLAYEWPGNVRELSNCIERSVALARFDQLVVDDLPTKINTFQASHIVLDADDPADFVTLEELESRYIRRVFEAVGTNKKLVARILGVDRTTLYRKLEKLGLHERG